MTSPLNRRIGRKTVLGAAPRTRLCGVVVGLVAIAAAVAQPANVLGRTLPIERPAPAQPKLWAIALDGKSRASLQPALFRAFALDGVNAIVTARTGWTSAGRHRLLQLTRATNLRLIEPQTSPHTHSRVAGLRSACSAAIFGADFCAVAVSSAAAARAWVRRGSVRYVVVHVTSPRAFTRFRVAGTTKTRVIAVLKLSGTAPMGAAWQGAMTTAARSGFDLAVEAGGTSSPALTSFLGILRQMKAASTQPASVPAGTANLFVSTSGNDSCTRTSTPVTLSGASGHICATPLRACQLAQSGDTVILEDGTYSGEMASCTGHESYAQNVVFEPEPGHECPMTYPNIPAPWSDTSCDVNILGSGGLNLGFGNNSSCGVASGNPLPSTLSAAQRATWVNHLTFKGMYLGDFGAICAAFIELDNDMGNHFYLGQGSYHFYIEGGDYGDRTDAEQPTIGDTTCGCSNWPPAEDVRVEHAVVHDFITQGAGHGDGILHRPVL